MAKISTQETRNDGPQIGVLRIAKITYDHKPIHSSPNGGSIGDMVDRHIAETINNGEMVSEVTLIFETHEQQHAIAEMYATKSQPAY